MNSHRHLLYLLAGRHRKVLSSGTEERRGAELWFITPPRTPITPDWRQLLAEAERTPPVSHLLLQVLAVGIASYWCQKL